MNSTGSPVSLVVEEWIANPETGWFSFRSGRSGGMASNTAIAAQASSEAEEGMGEEEGEEEKAKEIEEELMKEED
ncbi:hypothetical protein RP20_CCG002908 [Aedes albopictus]|nr:hypothetical protein RP20_CCG002908 [Aedes albopictus]